ncbi:MAG: amidohydrolase [Paracoccaceae bacterium]
MTDETWVPRMAARDDWLAQVQEEIIDPAREIVDPHHHLWVRHGIPYELDHLWADTGSGHNVVQTVFIECRAYYTPDPTNPMAPVAETTRVAEMAQTGRAFPDRAQLAGIVAHADLTHPDLDAVLDAHEAAGQGLFKGIRHAGARDPQPEHLKIPGRGSENQYTDPAFHKGVARLGERGLTYDTWQYHHQLPAFTDLARAVPGTTLVLDHLSTPLGVGRFTGRRNDIFPRWKDDIAALADCPNVVAKLGGMAMPDNGWGWHDRATPPGSDEFAEVMAPWYHHMIACFGPDRCMFESNFPVDRISISYHVLWNGFKKIATDYDEASKTAMFSETARRVYGL